MITIPVSLPGIVIYMRKLGVPSYYMYLLLHLELEILDWFAMMGYKEIAFNAFTYVSFYLVALYVSLCFSIS
jgi:hypothetical protein